MSELLVPPRREEPPASAPPRRTTTGRRVALLAGAAVLVLASAVVALPSAVGLDQPVSLTFSGDAPIVTLPGYGEEGLHAMPYQHGALVTISLPLANGGPLPIEVRDVDLGQRPRPMLERVAVDSARGARPFRLAPGETAQVHLSFRYDNCEFYTERAIDVYRSATVHYAVAGVPARREVAFDHPVAVRSAVMLTCPERVSDRGYNRRNGG